MIFQDSAVPAAARGKFGSILLALAVVAAFGALLVQAGTARSQACQPLLASGDFSDASLWTMQSSGTYPLIDNYRYRSAPVAAHLGGVNAAADTIGTVVALPPDMPAILEFWWYVDTVDDNEDAGFDYMVIEIENELGVVLRQLEPIITNYDAGSDWKSYAANLSDFAGQSIRIQFKARTDERNISDFYVDDVSVGACDWDFDLFLPLTQN